MVGNPINCERCGKFVGKGGKINILHNDYTGGSELIEALCERCYEGDKLREGEPANCDRCGRLIEKGGKFGILHDDYNEGFVLMEALCDYCCEVNEAEDA